MGETLVDVRMQNCFVCREFVNINRAFLMQLSFLPLNQSNELIIQMN